MLVNIVILQDEDRSITDVVGFSNFKEAERMEQELSLKFGSKRVQRTSLTVDDLPAFWGLVQPAAG